MKTKLILFEGIPGSGKTTLSIKAEKYLIDNGINAKCYTEGGLHPADLAWLSYLTLDEYHDMLNKYPQHADVIKKNSTIEEDMVLVAFTKLGLHKDENELMTYLRDKEIFDGKLTIDEFLEVNIKRWKSFCKKAAEDDIVYIFECAFLQNHICEIIAYNEVNTEYITDYFNQLISTVLSLNPTLVYLNQPDIRATIERVSKARVSPKNSTRPDWIDMCIDYVENCKYGKNNNLHGFDGTIQFFDHRVKTELTVIENLSIDTLIVDNHSFDWDAMFTEITAFMNDRLQIQ
ncbi:MAG: thymidylate kinase [Clostridiales bacterium]|nr:thymidylate kinase [Clostridiales bacterium]